MRSRVLVNSEAQDKIRVQELELLLDWNLASNSEAGGRGWRWESEIRKGGEGGLSPDSPAQARSHVVWVGRCPRNLLRLMRTNFGNLIP